MTGKTIINTVIRRELEREVAELPSEKELETFYVSQWFYDRIDYLFRSQERQRWFRWAEKHVACIFLVLFLGVGVVCSLNGSVQAVCVRWFQSYVDNGMTEYTVAESSEPSDPDERKRYELGYIPEGYERDYYDSDTQATYKKGEKLLDFTYGRGEEQTMLIDNEHSELSHITLKDGTVCDYYKAKENGWSNILVWTKDGYLFCLLGEDMDRQTLVRMAESVRQKK